MVESPSWSLPLPQWLLIQAITGLTASFTSPHSLLRHAAVVAAVALAWSVQAAVNSPDADKKLGGPLAAMGWVNVLNAIDLLLLSRVSYQEQIEWEKQASNGNEKSAPSIFRQFGWSFNIAFNYRRVHTPWQIAYVPQFDKNDRKYIPSRLAFIGKCGLEVCIAAAMLHFFTVETTFPGLAEVMPEIARSKRVMIPSAATTLQSILVQASFTLSFGILTRSAIILPYNAVGVICVALGVCSPAAWPPVSGSLSEAYSLRQFWRSAWHQSLRRPLVASTDCLLFSLLRLTRGTLAACYIRLFLVFFMSGLVHAFMDMGFTVPLEETGSLWFFVLQVPAIIAEIIFQKFCSKTGGKLRQILGYVWVLSFLAWATPVWIDPIIWRLYEGGIRVPSPFLFIGGHSFLE
ncbi:hypothetical protein MW887_006472 [Aspergillus wentii]|nr:hypothetical protein MW887_006472 [Aspergillus wentii]